MSNVAEGAGPFSVILRLDASLSSLMDFHRRSVGVCGPFVGPEIVVLEQPWNAAPTCQTKQMTPFFLPD